MQMSLGVLLGVVWKYDNKTSLLRKVFLIAIVSAYKSYSLSVVAL